MAGVAREFEELGYDYLTCGEHVSFNVPTSNSFISLAVAAGATSRIGLMNSIALVPLYPAALLAKLGAALDVASGGRFSLGVGVGGEIPREFEACGVPRNERGARTNEALDVIRRLWTEPTVTYEGRFNTLHDVGIEPHPVSAPHPPIWVSGRKEAAMRRTARYADGWLPYMYTPEQLAESYETIGRMRAEEGRGDDPVRGGLFIFACVHADGAKAQEMADQPAVQAVRPGLLVAGGQVRPGRHARRGGRPPPGVHRVGARTIVLSSACDTGYIDENHRLLAEEVVPAFRGPSS